jgi:caffeoyl-CoA O-methyltransferase
MSGQRLVMTDELYGYLDSVNDREPPVLTALREETEKDPRKNMAIHPMQGQFMGVLVRALQPKKIVEVGTFTGYSSLSMALAMPADAEMWCFDISEEWTALARRFWEEAGLADRIDLRLAPAAESLQALLDEGHEGTVDLLFLDADKQSYPTYWELGLQLLRPNGLVIVDNTMFQELVPARMTDDAIRTKYEGRDPDWVEMIVESVHAVRAFNAQIVADDRVDTAMVPVGDGMTFAVKL